MLIRAQVDKQHTAFGEYDAHTVSKQTKHRRRTENAGTTKTELGERVYGSTTP